MVSMLNLFESLKQAKPSQNQEAMKVENAQYDKVRGIHDSDIGPRIIFWCQLREFYQITLDVGEWDLIDLKL